MVYNALLRKEAADAVDTSTSTAAAEFGVGNVYVSKLRCREGEIEGRVYFHGDELLCYGKYVFLKFHANPAYRYKSAQYRLPEGCLRNIPI